MTGAAHLDVRDVEARVKRVREFTRLPVGVGFGIRDAQSASAIGAVADAIEICSALSPEIEQDARERAAERATRFLTPIREALDSLAAAKV